MTTKPDLPTIIAEVRRLDVKPDHEAEALERLLTLAPQLAEAVGALMAERDALSAEVAELKDPKLWFREMRGDEDGLSLTVTSAIVPLMVEHFGALLDQYEAENYLAHTVISQTLGTFVVTIQRKHGKTPHEKRAEAEAETARLQAEVARLRGLLVDAEHYLCMQDPDGEPEYEGWRDSVRAALGKGSP